MKAYSEQEVLTFLLEAGCSESCSILSPKDNAVSFLKNRGYLGAANKVRKKIYVLCSPEVASEINNENINALPCLAPAAEVFVCIHNEINKDREPNDNIIDDSSEISPKAVIGPDGNKIIEKENGTLVRMKHVGNVVVEKGVKVDALAVIHRASIDSTVVGEDTTICSHVNIGHNCIIGKRTAFTMILNIVPGLYIVYKIIY